MKKDKKAKYIILTNDDGINSLGLKILYQTVKDIAKVFVVAPASERSGASHSLTVWETIRVERIKFEDTYAYRVFGTPVDCAKIAILKLAKRKPDLLISGINHGPNICQFIFYSGTVGAAAEGVRMSIPSISFSIDNFCPKNFTFARKIICKIVKSILQKKIKIPDRTLLNINIPYLDENFIKGIKVIKTGNMEYEENYEMKKKRKILYFNHIIGNKKKKKQIDTDADALINGYVTVTPMRFDFNDYKSFKKLRKELNNIF